MLKIRLTRTGKKGQVHFRLVVNESTKDVWGDVLENLGTYDPKTKKAELKKDRIKHYIANGAQTSDTVNNLLITQGIIEGKKRSVTNISNRRRAKLEDTKVKKEEAKKKADEAKAAAAEKAKAEAEAAKAAEAEAKAKAEADAKAAEEAAKAAPAAEPAPEAPAAEAAPTETPTETPAA